MENELSFLRREVELLKSGNNQMACMHCGKIQVKEEENQYYAQ